MYLMPSKKDGASDLKLIATLQRIGAAEKRTNCIALLGGKSIIGVAIFSYTHIRVEDLVGKLG